MISNTDLKGAALPAPVAAGAGDRPAAFEFDLVHNIPGRLRLRSTALKDNACACEQARHYLAQIGGVKEASTNSITGSVLLGYDPNLLSPGKVIDVLAAHGIVLRGTEAETEAGGKWAEKLASVVTDWAINALTERLAEAMIAALA